jgi:dolichol kinase
MVDLSIGPLTPVDVGMAVATGIIVSVVLTTAYYLASSGRPKWKARKLVHTSMGTLVGFTLVGYSNLSGPAFAAGIFVFILFYAWAHKSELIWDLLLAGSRDEDTRAKTFMAGFMGMISFSTVFLLFFSRPEIFVTAILAVAWGDAAGEIVGRPYGGRIFKRKYRNKSVEGSIAVFIFTLLSILVSLLSYSPYTCILCIMPQILIVTILATTAEVLSIGWTDNFFIPMVTAIAMWWFVFPGIILFPM